MTAPESAVAESQPDAEGEGPATEPKQGDATKTIQPEQHVIDDQHGTAQTQGQDRGYDHGKRAAAPASPQQGSGDDKLTDPLAADGDGQQSGESNGSQQASSQRTQSHLSESQSLDEVVSEMFGERRKATSESYKTLHQGIVWRDLRVYGAGLGSTFQRTSLDSLLRVPRMIYNGLTFWRWRRRQQIQNQTVAILHGFSVSEDSPELYRWPYSALTRPCRDACDQAK
ncbi:hypothetical protein KEM52_005490 [Ascosphaera acerosa]|nr:hypothetical protein KEM52_005490 [Ascosphaera acerosa]